MTEYNSFGFNPWGFPSGQQSPQFPPYPTDALNLLEQEGQPPLNSAWTSWFPPASNQDPNDPRQDSQQLHRLPPVQPHANQSSAHNSNNYLPPPLNHHKQSPFQSEGEARSALKNLVDGKQQPQPSSPKHSLPHPHPSSIDALSQQQRQHPQLARPRMSFDINSHSPATTNPAESPRDSQNHQQQGSPSLPNPPPSSSTSNVAMNSFLNGFTSSSAYAPPVSQEDYIRLLKQAAAQQHATNSMFGFSAPPPGSLLNNSNSAPSPSSARPSSSSSNHSHPLYPQPSTSNTATFSLPTPAHFAQHQQQPSHHSRPHERTPSANSSIRTSSNDRVGGSVLDSPRGTYPTYPSPQQSLPLHPLHLPHPHQHHHQQHQHSNPYLPQHFSHPGIPGIGGEGYNPSEPYIALQLPQPPPLPQHQQPIPSHLLPSTSSSSPYPGSNSPIPGGPRPGPGGILPNSLGFCPPAPPGTGRPAPSSLQYSSTGQPQQHEEGGYGSDGTNREWNGKGKGKMVDGFVPPRSGNSNNDGRAGSISSSNGGRKRGYPGRGGGEGENNDQDDDEFVDEEGGGGGGGEDGGGGAFTRQPVASTSSQTEGGDPSKPTSIILPNSIDPVTGQLRRQTEVPAVEDDPSVRPYGCNYCYLDRTVDPAIRSYWEQQEALHDGYKVSWRTVKELREHNQREHKERTEKLKEHEQMMKDEGATNGKGPDLPYRCALEPCGKTFKSLAGLRFHFQNASANGHFFVTLEKDQKTGEERAMKKFKQDIQPNGRELSCPVDRCPKRFKQSAGLAYHLSHTPNHEITEALVSTFENTLQSKTRWWFRKLGLEFAQ
ncbi:hypothetical protein JCM16303_004119 [Sporobolomyces ruberrimus]